MPNKHPYRHQGRPLVEHATNAGSNESVGCHAARDAERTVGALRFAPGILLAYKPE